VSTYQPAVNFKETFSHLPIISLTFTKTLTSDENVRRKTPVYQNKFPMKDARVSKQTKMVVIGEDLFDCF